MTVKFFMKVFFVFAVSAFALTAGMPAVAFGDDDDDAMEMMENFEAFVTNVIEKAGALTGGKRHFDQDVEFVENEMDGDEMVYMRAWQGDGFFVIYGYLDDTWEDDYVAYFWTYDPGLRFNGVGVGSSLADLKEIFGDILYEDPSAKSCNAMMDGMYLTFAMADGKVGKLRYVPEVSMTTKMGRYVEAYEQSLTAKAEPAEARAASNQNQEYREARPTQSRKEEFDFDKAQREAEIDYCERNIRGTTQVLEANKRWLAEELRKKNPNQSQVRGFQNTIAAKEKELAQYQARLQKALSGR